jgi:hypothetical protein
MFGSTILEVATGLVFSFLAISLFTSAGVEAINSALKLRATNLLSGVQALVNDPNFTGLARQLYQHASISPMGPGGDTPQNPSPYKNKTNLPSYIDKAQFARALLDVTGLSAATPAEAAQASGPQAIAALNAQVAAIADPQIRQLLQGIVSRTSGDVKQIEKEVADWFDNGMDRLSGTFKRRTQLFTFLVALPIAFIFNMDAIRVGTLLWEHPSLAEGLKTPTALPSDVLQGKAPATEEQEMAVIDSLAQADLPVGWAPGHFLEVSDSQGHWVSIWSPTIVFSSLLGWVITAAAALFGAPFWFDTLQSIIRLKGSGPSPAEKRSGRAAAN